MKRYTAILVTALFCLAGCTEKENNTISLSGTLVPAQITSSTAISVNIDEYVPIVIEWGGSSWDGIGFMTYDIAFDRLNGDFSRPVAVFHVPEIGDSSRALSKDEIKSVFSAASDTPKDRNVSVQWIVRTSAGTQRLSSEAAIMHMEMTPDPDAFIAGNPIFIAGEGAKEKGRHFTYIPNIDYDFNAEHYNDNSSLKEFNYEIFTELEAGKAFYFWSGTTTGDKDWYFTVDSSAPDGYSKITRSIKQDADTTASISISGTYRIRMNTYSGDIYIKRISSVSLRYWNSSGVIDNTMEYNGNGTWSIRLDIANGCYGYKFLFFGLDGDQPTGSEYPSVEYSGDRSDKYWHIVPVKGGAATANNPRAAGTWGFPTGSTDKESLYTIYMNDIYGSYTHYIE